MVNSDALISEFLVNAVKTLPQNRGAKMSDMERLGYIDGGIVYADGFA